MKCNEKIHLNKFIEKCLSAICRSSKNTDDSNYNGNNLDSKEKNHGKRLK